MIALFAPLLRKFVKPAVILVVVAGLLFEINALFEARIAREKAARDTFWQAAIMRANAEAEAERTRRDRETATMSRAAEAEITALRDTLLDMERKNAALPNGGNCGLDAGRARLLNAR